MANSISIVVVGAGPAGFYAADALIKKKIACKIDLVDELPTPYGLIRSGVAPDHQTTKKIIKAFEKIALNPICRFFGNVNIGNDVSIEELKNIYDVIIISNGANSDKKLGIPGEDLEGVIGSASFVGWYNAHPKFVNINPDLSCKNVVVVGNGNVAIDIARVLVKNRDEMASSDIPEYALKAIENSMISDVHILGRRGPHEAKFTNVELREMGELQDAVSLVDPNQIPKDVGCLEDSREKRLKEKNHKTFLEFSKNKYQDADKRVNFQFWAKPVKIIGTKRVESILMEKTVLIDGNLSSTEEFFEIKCGIVIPSVGYKSTPIDDLPFDHKNNILINENGRVSEGIYVVGWMKRGPSGVISTNRPDGVLVSDHISKDFSDGGGKPGREKFIELLESKNIRYIKFDDWKLIDKAEISSAEGVAPRRKIEKIEEMLNIAYSE